MSYHRGGHPGAVAISYNSTSTMAPLSPSRRYSGSTGGNSGNSGSSSGSGITNASLGHGAGGVAVGSSSSKYATYRLSSSSSSSNLRGDRIGSHYSSPSNGGYRTNSSSLISSTTSDTYRRAYFSPARSVSTYNETSSGTSLRYASGSSSSASSTTSSTASSCTPSRERNGTVNSHPTPGSLATTAADFYAIYSPTHYIPNIHGGSSSNTANGHQYRASLDGGDEYDSSRQRRDRSYSSEANNDRWLTPRRDSIKRKTTPIVVVQTSGGTATLAGHAHLDSALASTEVTQITDSNDIVSATTTTTTTTDCNIPSFLPESSTSAINHEQNTPAFDKISTDHDVDVDVDVDNNNARTTQSCNNNEHDSIIKRETNDCTRLLRQRRKPGNADLDRHDDGDDDDDDQDQDQDQTNAPLLTRNNRDDCNNEKGNCSENSTISGDCCGKRRFQQQQQQHHHHHHVQSSISPNSEFSYQTANGDATQGIAENLFNKQSVGGCGDGGGGGGGGGGSGGGNGIDAGDEADHHRRACMRTKIVTNHNNTELLTNYNAQDRETLGIVDNHSRIASDETRKKSESSIPIVAGARKSLLWTATNQIDGAFDTSNETVEKNERVDICGSSILKNSETIGDNRFNDSSIYDRPNERETNNGIEISIRGSVMRGDDPDPNKPSTSKKITDHWNEPNLDDPAGSSSSDVVAATDATVGTSGNSTPAAVHHNLYRRVNESIDSSSNSRGSRNRLQQCRRDERCGLNGLRNIGNTCFMNSVIQCLSNTRPLLEYLLNEQHLQDINTTTSSMKGALIKAFGQVINQLWEMSGEHVVNTSALKSQIQRFAPRFMGYSQQDAQEFLRYLLEGLHEDVNRVIVKPQPILTDIPDHYSDSHKAAESWKRYLRSEDSTIVDVFVGQLRSSLHCTSCDHVSVTLDPFWDLSLPIPSRSGTVKLNQCLEHFTKVETLDGDEKPTCSKCQMRRKCTKRFSIQKFPKILVIHLKRFSPMERFRGKLSVLVDFPLTSLDLSAFAAPGVQGCTYNLYGVANHSGTTYSGHYTAYCKHPYSGDWHEYNDSRVSSVTGRSVVSSEAYVLFYEQQHPSPHL